MAESGEYIFSWLGLLDELTYYELFGVESDASADDVRAAFHSFCDVFHPDRHLTRTQEERDALSAIFKRSTEAYLVLSDESLRSQYDRNLAVRTTDRPPRISHSARAAPRKTQGAPAKLEDAVRSPSSRPFARRAEELMRAGDFRQAKLQLVMANHLDPENEAIETALRELEARLGPRN